VAIQPANKPIVKGWAGECNGMTEGARLTRPRGEGQRFAENGRPADVAIVSKRRKWGLLKRFRGTCCTKVGNPRRDFAFPLFCEMTLEKTVPRSFDVTSGCTVGYSRIHTLLAGP